MLLFLCSGFNANSQEIPEPFKMNEAGFIEMSQVSAAEGMSQEEIYGIVRLWFAVNFKNSNEVLQADDKEKGILMGHTWQSFKDYQMWYGIKILIKEGSYKVDLSNFIIKGNEYGNFPAELAFYQHSVRKDGTVRKYPQQIRDELLNIQQAINQSLQKSVVMASSGSEEDW